MLKKILLILLFFVLFTGLEVNAQGGSPCVPTPTSPCPPPGRPIDGGVAVLLALGAAYGARKLKKED